MTATRSGAPHPSAARRPEPSPPSPGSPRGEALLAALPSLVHDLRGPVTAASAFCQLLASDFPEAGDEARAHLAAIAAGNDQIAHVVDGLALLATTQPGRAPLSEVVGEAAARWQKVLSRVGLTLNLSGEFPDTPVERRALRVALGSMVLVASKAAEGSSSGMLDLGMSPGTTRLVARLVLRDGGRARRLDEMWQEATREQEFSGLVTKEALAQLEASVEAACESDSAASLVLRLPAVGGGAA